MAGNKSDIQLHTSYGAIGIDMDSGLSQIKPGKLTYALNAIVDGNSGEDSVYYQNEPRNEYVLTYPDNTQVIGKRTIVEIGKCIILLYSSTGKHEIGYIDLNDNAYHTLTTGACLNFDIDHPVNKIEYEINGDAVRIYWADDYNPNRYLDIDRLAFKQEKDGDCVVNISKELDCNRLKVQPNFSIPFITDIETTSGGSLVEGTYQFGIQYADAKGTQYTSVYNITDPISVFKDYVSQDFNLPTGKALSITVNNLDTTAYEYFNLIVVKTINNIPSYELVGTYPTSSHSKKILYTGEDKTAISLTADDVFQKFPVYDRSKGVTQSDKVLIWNGVTESKRVNYQPIASQIELKWIKYKVPYSLLQSNPELVDLYRGYLAGETYAFEFQPILSSGKQCDGFHIPGRLATESDREHVLNPLFDENICSIEESSVEKWVIRDTSSVTYKFLNDVEDDPQYQNSLQLKSEIDTITSDISSINETINSLYKKITEKENFIIDVLNVSVAPLPSAAKQLGPERVDLILEGVHSNPVDKDKIAEAFDINITPVISSAKTRIDITAEEILIIQNDIKTLQSEISRKYVDLNELYIEYNKLGDVLGLCSPLPYEEGSFGYYESEEAYPCNEDIWGDLAGKPIRHHKFPKGLSHDDEGNVYVLGVSIDVDKLKDSIKHSPLSQDEKDDIVGFKILRANRVNHKSIIAKGIINNIGIYNKDGETFFYPNYPYNDVRPDPFISISQTRDDSGNNSSLQLNGFYSEESKKRYTFHSPDTSFYQPNLGDYIELNSVEYGQSKGHFIPVKEHPKYQIPSRASYATAVAITLGLIAASSKEGIGPAGLDFLGGSQTNWQVGLTVMLDALDIISKSIPHKELAYQFNSVGDYSSSKVIPDTQETIFPITSSSRYISDGLANISDIYELNNFLRETCVYLRTDKAIPFTHALYPDVQDTSRWILSDNDCSSSVRKETISSYNVSIKRLLKSQYGQIYSYETIDTGYYYDLKNNLSTSQDIFGGDTFVSRFAYKSKHSFFTQNLVGRQDNLALDFRNYGNIGYPTYWLSNERDGKFTWGDAYQEAGSILAGAAAGGLGSMSIGGAVRGAAAGAIIGGIGVLLDNWQNNFDCPGKKFFYQDGKFYLFAYGIPYFYTETDINLFNRQAYNSKEGDFYPHVSGDIPDEWLQEVNVPIVNDNTYWYNKTFSKQNKENYFSHLPNDFDPDGSLTYTNRAVYSEKQSSETNYKVNKWLIYRPVSYYDFPQSNGKLISLDRIENNAILARFENKSELYNAQLRIDTSNPQAVYLGNSTLFSSAPPIDYSDTDTGYMGSQHTLFLKTPYGDISVDAERGNVFLIAGQKAKDITSGISKFLNTNLPFKIKKAFPNFNIDNAFNGIGLTATYDNTLSRVIITKLDYYPIKDISYKNGHFVYNNQQVDLTDPEYFLNHSFTVSFDLAKQAPISFHSYLPNYYIQTSNNFYSNSNNTLWVHDPLATSFNSFYGNIEPYIIEYPQSYQYRDEILQYIKDYSKVYLYNDPEDSSNFIEVDDIFFDSSILYSNQQCSGILQLTKKPSNNMSGYMKYPIYNTDSKTILYTKSNSFYQYNTFWSLVKDKTKPLFKRAKNLSLIKEIYNENMDYSKRSFKKEPIRTKDLKIRHTLSSTDKYKILSQFILSQTQQSYK